jgi:transcription elongation factor GreA
LGEIMHNELTKKDIEDMEAEIEHRKVVVRKELLEHVKEARAHGDLSENFEYYAAKKAKNQNESRIRFLERMIKTAKVVDDNTKDDEVGMNKTVTIRIEEDGTLETYKIVTTMRKNSLKGLVSIESPLGKQLLGHRVGDRVTIKVSDDFSYDVTIIKIENTGLTDDDTIRDF